MPRTTTSKLSIPRDLMDYWQHWRHNHGLTPTISHVALYIFTRLSAEDRNRALTICNDEYRSGAILVGTRETKPPFSCKMLSGQPRLYAGWFKTSARFNVDTWSDLVVYTSARGAYDAAMKNQHSPGEIIVVEMKPQALFSMSDRADLLAIVGRIGPDGRERRLVNIG